MESGKTYTLDELAAAAEVNPRTIRYYIQLQLLDPPQGQTRAARYTLQHLQRLAAIKKLTDQGLSLERVAQVLAEPAKMPEAARAQRPGALSVRTHIFLAPGIDLVIDPESAGLSGEELRQLVRALVGICERHQASSHKTQE